MPITFAVKIILLKVYMAIVSPMTLNFIQGHKHVFLTCNIWDNIQAITFKLGMMVDVYMAL